MVLKLFVISVRGVHPLSWRDLQISWLMHWVSHSGGQANLSSITLKISLLQNNISYTYCHISFVSFQFLLCSKLPLYHFVAYCCPCFAPLTHPVSCCPACTQPLVLLCTYLAIWYKFMFCCHYCTTCFAAARSPIFIIFQFTCFILFF